MFENERALLSTHAFIGKYILKKTGPGVIKMLNSFRQTHFVQYAEDILIISLF